MDLLAQLTDTQFTPAQAVTWLSIAVVVVGGGLLGIQRFRKAMVQELKMELQAQKDGASVKLANAPLDVREHQDVTPLPLHQELQKRVEDLRDEVSGRVEELRAEMNARFIESAHASAESRGKIYDLLREQGNANSAVATETKLTSARVAQIDTKIDTLLMRMGAKVTSQ